MKFTEVVGNIARTNDLKRIAKARLFDISRLGAEELKEKLLGEVSQYSDPKKISDALRGAILNDDRDIRTIAPILLGEVLLQEQECILAQNAAEDAVIDWEQSVIQENLSGDGLLRKIHNFEFFRFVLEAAWENNNSISRDEKNLIEKIRVRLRISEREYRLVEASLHQFPKSGNEVHQRDEIDQVRRYLQEVGLLLTFRNSDGDDCDVVPDEMVSALRKALGIEIRQYGYRQLLGYKMVRKIGYLTEVLKKAEVAVVGNPKLPELQELCAEHVSPRILLGGLSPKDGLEKGELEKWCRELALQISGTKDELIARIIGHYDNLIERTTEVGDEREAWFNHFEEFGSRNYAFLRAQELIEKDLEVESKFEKATDFLFEMKLGHRPLPLPGSEQPDGCLALKEGVLFWDNKSKETQCDLRKHLSQFDRYFRKSEKTVYALLVIAPDFTPESHNVAVAHEIQTGNKLALITAQELKEIASRWSGSSKRDDPFPLRYFAITGRFIPDILATVFS